MSFIYEASSLCLRLFEILCYTLKLGTVEHQDLMSPAMIEDEYGRFRVWAGSLGALQKGHSGLDYRLRESSIMQANVTAFLKQLQTALEESMLIPCFHIHLLWQSRY